MLKVGKTLDIHYPVTTHIRFLSGGNVAYRKRTIVIKRIRDLVTHPLTPEEFLQRPYVSRSRWLILGWEPHLQQYRQFYLGNALEFSAPRHLYLGLYEPGCLRPAQILYRPVGPTMTDRKALVRAIEKIRAFDFDSAHLRIFASDMAVS